MEIKIGDLAKLDKVSLLEVQKFIKNKINKSLRLQQKTKQALNRAGSEGNEAYLQVQNEILDDLKLSAADKAICLSILRDEKLKRWKDGE